MIDHPGDFERRRMQQRLVELRNQVHEISGGEAEFGPAGSGLSLEQEVAFLEHIVAFETAPRTTWLDRLRDAGYDMPDPAGLSDAEIELETWQVIQRLSELRGFLYHTDHFSDRELYERLYWEMLREETIAVPPHPDSACHLDLIGSGSDEDIACWLRFYADEKERQDWVEQFPDGELPPAEKPPQQFVILQDRKRRTRGRYVHESDPYLPALSRQSLRRPHQAEALCQAPARRSLTVDALELPSHHRGHRRRLSSSAFTRSYPPAPRAAPQPPLSLQFLPCP